jgi:hypothetical protein
MDTHESLPRPGVVTRFDLSARGRTSEAAYRRSASMAPGRRARSADGHASVVWAIEHGLEPADGPYLIELAARPLTLNQLGEALAIHSQSREMIGFAVARLVSKGFVRMAGRVPAAV